MVEQILEAAGFIRNKTYRETRFLKPPANQTYCIYNDTEEIRGHDSANAIVFHEVNVEMYEYAPDPISEAALETALDQAAMPYIKQNRYWMNDEQLYQIIYEFNYTIKKGD